MKEKMSISMNPSDQVRRHHSPKHENPRSPCGTTVTRDSEKLSKLREEILALINLSLELYSDVGVISVTGGLDVGVSEALEGPKGLFHFVMLDIPTAQNVSLIQHEICTEKKTYRGDSGQK